MTSVEIDFNVFLLNFVFDKINLVYTFESVIRHLFSRVSWDGFKNKLNTRNGKSSIFRPFSPYCNAEYDVTQCYRCNNIMQASKPSRQSYDNNLCTVS